MNQQLAVLEDLYAWLEAGHRAVLLTLCRARGVSPCPEGALCAIRDDGRLSGSISGGLLEDALIDDVRSDVYWGGRPCMLEFHASSKQEPARRLPAGSGLSISLEPGVSIEGLADAIAGLRARRVLVRELDLDSGEVTLTEASGVRTDAGDTRRTARILLRPTWRVLPVGDAGLLRHIIRLAAFVDFKVVDCTASDAKARQGTRNSLRRMATANAPIESIALDKLDPMTIVLALDDAARPAHLATLRTAALRHGAIFCTWRETQTIDVPSLATIESDSAGHAFRIDLPIRRTLKERAIALVSAIAEMRAHANAVLASDLDAAEVIA